MDKNGKSTKKTAAYTYDMLGRITRETKPEGKIFPTYDANNNRKQMTIGNKTTAYQYNKKRRTAPHRHAAYRHGEERCGYLQER